MDDGCKHTTVAPTSAPKTTATTQMEAISASTMQAIVFSNAMSTPARAHAMLPMAVVMNASGMPASVGPRSGGAYKVPVALPGVPGAVVTEGAVVVAVAEEEEVVTSSAPHSDIVSPPTPTATAPTLTATPGSSPGASVMMLELMIAVTTQGRSAHAQMGLQRH